MPTATLRIYACTGIFRCMVVPVHIWFSRMHSICKYLCSRFLKSRSGLAQDADQRNRWTLRIVVTPAPFSDANQLTLEQVRNLRLVQDGLMFRSTLTQSGFQPVVYLTREVLKLTTSRMSPKWMLRHMHRKLWKVYGEPLFPTRWNCTFHFLVRVV